MSNEYVHFINNSQPAINEDNLNLMQQLIKQDINGAVSGDTLPIGAIIPWATTIAPNQNWLVCNGQAVSRTTYSQLFNIIGTQYGKGDGSTTFNVPDLRGRHPMGYNLEDTDFNRIGKTGGEKTHALTKNELPVNMIDTANSGSNTDGYIARAGYTKTGSYNFGGGSQPFNVLDPYLTTNYIIKAFQTAGVVAEVVNARNDSQTKVYSTNYINSKFLKVFTVQFTLGTFTRYQDKYDQTYTITNTDIPDNYTPIGIVGHQIYGAYSSHCTYTSLILQSARTVLWGVKNNTDVTAGSLGTNLKILAIKNS